MTVPVPESSRASGWRTIRRVAPYLWPPGEREVKVRVVAAMVALVLGRLASVVTPFFFKAAVDGLAPADPAAQVGYLVAAGPVALTLFYGVMRLASVGFTQLRDGVFARVGQGALRHLALETFRHVHALSLRYHITRKTGGLSRVIERGVKGVDFLLRFLLFSIVPLVLELVLVGAILFFVFDVWYLVVVVVTIWLYVWFTFKLTEWRLAIRARMNERDTDANQKAIDSLLNFETVKYFNAEDREAGRYDASMQGYEKAAIETQISLTWLNFGQGVIITAGLAIVMVMAALGVQAGKYTVGDFVMVNAYMIQITMPLNFLGTVYRENPPEPRGHGGALRPAGAAGGDRRPAGGAAAPGRPRPDRVPRRELRLRERAPDPARTEPAWWSRGRPWRWWGLPARASRPSPGWSSASTRSRGARS